MSKRLTYREQLDKARQQAAVAALREAARLTADGDYTQAVSMLRSADHDLQELCTVLCWPLQGSPAPDLVVTKVDHDTKTITFGPADV